MVYRDLDLHRGIAARAVSKNLAVAALAALASAAPLRAVQAPEIPGEVKESICLRVDNGYNAGIVVGLVTRGGTQYYSYGKPSLSGGGTLDENTIFEIGSITKVFTSILLADMVERGEVGLDDPIERYLPEGVAAPRRNGRSITLLDLATHTSGLPRLPDNMDPADPSNPYADYSVEQMYAFLSGHELQREPGAEYEYSNFGAGLLGHLLARRTGRTYEQLVTSRISDELGMPDTRITLTADMRARLARGHSGETEVANWDVPTLAGAGALRSSARDMLTFLAANMGLRESRLYSSMNSTHQPRRPAGSANMQVGLGWHVLSTGERQIVWHNGGTGGYRSFIGFVPGEDVGVVVLTNSSTSADDIGFHVLEPGVPLRQVRTPVAIEPAVLEAYVGQYQIAPGLILDIGLADGNLTVQLTGQPRFTLYAESETEFFLTVVDAQISFVRDDEGNVTALVLHQGGRDQPATRLR
jgi:CubicO group peptidase (beta-lactamase class C family)